MRFACLISSCLLFETKFETFHLLYFIAVFGIRKLQLLSSITDFELVLKRKKWRFGSDIRWNWRSKSVVISKDDSKNSSRIVPLRDFEYRLAELMISISEFIGFPFVY